MSALRLHRSIWLDVRQRVSAGLQLEEFQQSRYLTAFLTSWGITLAQYLFVKYAAAQGGPIFLLVSGMGGALGIVAAIWVHDNWTSRKETSNAA